jgi:hypothetical protein
MSSNYDVGGTLQALEWVTARRRGALGEKIFTVPEGWTYVAEAGLRRNLVQA